jgi:hypothetical protein
MPVALARTQVDANLEPLGRNDAAQRRAALPPAAIPAMLASACDT